VRAKREAHTVSNRAMKRLASMTMALVSSGCALSTPGELGKLEFRILVDDAAGGSSEILPIAPNTEVVVRVTRPGGRAALVTDFRVDEPWVVSITRESHDALRIKARAVGDTRLSVRAGGDDDRIMLNVLAPIAARVWGPVSYGRERPLAVRGGTARFPLTLTGAGRQRVLALGVPPPIRVVPEGAATITPPKAREGAMVHVTFERAGLLRLQGDLDEALEIRVLADDELEQLELDLVKTDPKRAPPGLIMGLRGVVAGRRSDVVSSGAQVTVDTPEICSESPEDARSGLRFGQGVVVIEALAAGRCSGTVTFAGKSATFAQDVALKLDAQR
jgi:hypothetical protein